MKRLACLLALALAACGSSPAPAPSPAPTSWTITNGTVAVTAEARFGSSITHVVMNGFDYDNIVDHGREWQVAYQLDGMNEGENPTEAGSAADAAGPTSTTVILSAAALAPNVFASTVHPAYWYPYQGQLVSPDTISKTVTVGVGALTNVVRWDVTIRISTDHSDGHFEPLAAYYPHLPYFYVQQADGTFALTPGTDGGTDTPPTSWIAASNDGQQALGILAVPPPGLTWNQPNFGNSGTSAFGCGWISTPLAAGTYSMTCYVAVGTLTQVEAALTALRGP